MVKSRDGYTHALIAVEGLTCFPEVVPMRGESARDVANALIQVWCRYGASRIVRTDQGRNFESKLLKEILHTFQVARVRTTPGRPGANGKAEKMIRFVKDALSKFVDDSQKDWPEVIPPVLLSYRASDHTSAGYSPAELMFGRKLTLPADLQTMPPQPPGSRLTQQDLREYANRMRDTLRQLHQHAAENLRAASKVMKQRYDRTARLTGFTEGDKVWLYNPVRVVGKSPKLQRPWESGWVVEKVLNDILVRIKKDVPGRRRDTCKRRCVHVDRIARDESAPAARACEADSPHDTAPVLSILAQDLDWLSEEV